ncbi:MAG TPA: transcription termination/antitermination NusG family protein, partial [Dongiaceae bacterium]|nr:transcription termination/antitermination NusG family protein [Dongiaceae bacterium]
CPEMAWYCLRSHPKHEHIAAAHLRQELEVEAFLPRIRYKRSTRFGPAWVNEALFVNYLFARFDLATSLRGVQHARGVRAVVRFGAQWPTVPVPVIDELRAAMGDEELRIIDDSFHPGDAVEITGGPFDGLAAVVARVMPGPQRVAVLMEFLGRQTLVELDGGQVVSSGQQQTSRLLACAPS